MKNPNDEQLLQDRAERVWEYRQKFEWPIKTRYVSKTLKMGPFIAGLASITSIVILSVYTTTLYGADLPGKVFGISLATALGVIVLQCASFVIRREWAAKKHHDNSNILESSVTELTGYYAAAAALALGYFCAQTAIGGALTLEIAAIAGAITGAIIALPSIWLRAPGETQSTLPHGLDILSSAAAGAAALAVAHITAEHYFAYLGVSAVDTKVACVMHLAIAMPVFVVAKMILSLCYEGILTAFAYGKAGNNPGDEQPLLVQ